jgi:hemolysin-activating ACP:hemolysin acyltransferase
MIKQVPQLRCSLGLVCMLKCHSALYHRYSMTCPIDAVWPKQWSFQCLIWKNVKNGIPVTFKCSYSCALSLFCGSIRFKPPPLLQNE